MLLDNNTASSHNSVPDIFEAVQLLKRHKQLLAKLMLVFVAAGALIVLMIPSKYRAYATLVLNEQTLNINDFQSILTGAKLDAVSVKTEAKILISPSLAEKTIYTAELIQHPEYEWAKTEQDAMSAFISNLDIYTQNASRAIEVAFTAKDPKLAARIANVHATTYLRSQVAFKQEQVDRLSKWFEVKVKELKADAIAKAQAVQDFRAREKLVIGKDNKELIYQQISDVAGQLVPVEVSKYGYEAKSQNGAVTRAEALSDVVDSTLIQNLKTQAAIASQELSALRAQYGPNHPKVIEAQGQLNQANRAVDREINTIVDSMEQGKVSSQAQEELLRARLDGLNEEADGLREKMVTLESLQVEADASKKILDNFLKNYETIQSQASFAWPDATLVSPAIVPAKPIAPGKKTLLAIVLVVSALLSLGIVFTLELMRNGVKNYADIRKLAQKPLGIIPVTGNPIIAMKNTLQSSYKEAIKRIYMAGLMNSKARCILVTSAMPKEGRTSFTISMAHYLHTLGHSVVMVDADFHRPALSRLAGGKSGPGLADVLAGVADLEDALRMNEDGISILRSGTQALFSPDLLKSGKLAELIRELKQEYHYILVDAGPLLAHSEASAMATQTDGMLVIAEWLKTSHKNLTNLFESIDNTRTPVLGVVINKVDIDKYKAMSNGSDFLLPKAANAA